MIVFLAYGRRPVLLWQCLVVADRDDKRRWYVNGGGVVVMVER